MTQRVLIALCLLFTFSSLASAQGTIYPEHWWAPIARDSSTPDWEVLPQEAGPGEVILSKRNELGLLSNFAPTPFIYRGKKYASLEGFWQAMKYPEASVDGTTDPRAHYPGVQWEHTRQEVEQMVSFAAKEAGELASANMKIMRINWVSFEGHKMDYKIQQCLDHCRIIKEAMEEKLKQNPQVREVLLATGDLVLRPDHKVPDDNPPAWSYYKIWMEIREKIKMEGL